MDIIEEYLETTIILGIWKESNAGHLKCSRCGFEPFWTFKHDIPFVYCPYCGDYKNIDGKEREIKIKEYLERFKTENNSLTCST